MADFFAKLRGRFEVPPVETDATGTALFNLSRDGQQLRFLLKVKNIKRVTQAHIHLGRPGENGPVVAFLFGPSKFGITVRKGIVKGTLTSADLTGPLQGKTIANLVREIQRGNTYVNVHTEQNPDGEIRGQIESDDFKASASRKTGLKKSQLKGNSKTGVKSRSAGKRGR